MTEDRIAVYVMRNFTTKQECECQVDAVLAWEAAGYTIIRIYFDEKRGLK